MRGKTMGGRASERSRVWVVGGCGYLAAAALVPPAASASDFFWNTGDFVTGVTAPEPLVDGDTLFIQAGGSKRFVGSSFTNEGLVSWQADSLQGGNGASVSNAGVWQSESDANTLIWGFGGQPIFVNTGTFRKSAGVVTNVGTWLFRNDGGLIEAQAGNIVFNGDSNIFNAGSRFSGGGQVQVLGNSTFNGSFQADNLVITGGTQQGVGAELSGGAGLSAGLAGWTGGDLTGSWTIGTGTTVTGSGAGGKRQVGTDITNDGTFRWSTTQQLQGGNGSVFTNNGLTEVTESATFNWNFGVQHTFTNNASGTVRATNNATLTFGNVGLTSHGGLFEAEAGSAIVYSGDSNRFNDGTRFVGDNQVAGNSRFVDTIHSDNLRFVEDTQTGGDGVTPGSRALLAGLVNFEGGDLAGAWEIQTGATVTGSGATAKRQVGCDILNNGTFRWSTMQQLQGGNGSVFTNNGLTEVTESATFNWNFGGQHAFINNASGTVRATNNATLTFGNVGLTSHGGLFEAEAGSAIVYNGNSNRFNDGTRFVGDNQVAGNSRFVDTIHSDNLRFVEDTQTGGDGVTPDSRGRLTGVVSFEGGDLVGAWEIQAGATMTGSGATSKRQVGSDIINNGTFRWSTTQQFQGGNGSVFTNNSLTEVTESATFNWNFGGQRAFINNATGTVRATNNATLTFGNVGLTSNGGLFEAEPGSRIVYNGDSNRFNDGTRFVGDNRVAGNSRFVDTIQSDNFRLVSGTQTGGDGSADSRGRLAGIVGFEGGDLTGQWEIKDGATVTGSGAMSKRQVGSDIINNGTVVWASDANLQGGNSSVLTNNGRFEMATDADVSWNFGGQARLDNNGLFVKTGGAGDTSLASLALNNIGTIQVQIGTISLPNNFSNAGTLMGTGGFATNVLTNTDTVNPGNSLPGVLDVNAVYTQSAAGRLLIEIAGTLLGDDLADGYDQLHVSGDVNLDGLLNVDFVGGFRPSPTDTFTILTTDGVRSGVFSNTPSNLLTIPEGTFLVTYNPDSVVLNGFTLIPEPTTLGIVSLASLAGLRRRRA